MGNLESQAAALNGLHHPLLAQQRRQDLDSLIMHQALLQALSELGQEQESVTPEQREHAWDPEDCSSNFKVLPDRITARRGELPMRTDLIRGKKGYRVGKHVFEIYWPVDERGSHAMIGVATPLAPKQCLGYTYLLGATSESWGWNLVDRKITHGGQITGIYPPGKLIFQIPETFFVVLDADNGTLSFRVNNEDLGIAFSNLPTHNLLRPLCISASATCGNCDIRMKYLGSGGEVAQVTSSGEQIVSVPGPAGTSLYKFHPRCGDNIDVMHSGRVARRRDARNNYKKGVVLTRNPLETNELFEIRLDTKIGRWAGSLEIGFTTNSPESLDYPSVMTDCRAGVTLMWSGTNVVKNGVKVAELSVDLDDCTIGDRIGIVRKDDRSIHFYFNGQVLPKAVRLKNNPETVYGAVDVFGQAERVTIIEGGSVPTSTSPRQEATDTPVKEEAIGNDPNAIMFRMRETVDKLRNGKFSDMRQTIESVASNITQPYHGTDDRKIRQRFGDHLANIGGAKELTRLLERLVDMGMETQIAWAGISLVRSTCWNYSDASLKICKQFGQSGLLRHILADLDRYGPGTSKNQKRRFLIVSSISILHNCAKATENRQLYHDMRAIERIAPFLKSEDTTVTTVALLSLSYIVEEDKKELLEASTETIAFLLKVLVSALDDPKLRGQCEDGTFSALELAMGLGNIAVNDKNKSTMVEGGCIPLFVKLLQRGGTAEQECSANALWVLASMETNKAKIRSEPGALDTLKRLSTHSNDAVRQSAERALLVLKPAVPMQQMAFGMTASTGKKNCEYQQRCARFKASLNLSEHFFNKEFDMCYCTTCHTGRGDKLYYTRGQPAKDYGVPVGWCRHALKVHDRAHALDVFKKWHIAFHGTRLDAVKPILECGDLLMPGDVIMGGKELGEREGHFCPTWKPKGFDTKQIFLSPSIRYSGHRVYAFPNDYTDKVTNKTYKAKVVFQVYINPDSYKVGPQTIGETSEIDPKFDNQEIEWFTKQRGCVILYGLLVKLEE
ncbi:neuralized-like protein 4 [Ptychodera flava]|uniref:neuralized-like protein 4 n=1 Tax=Ptychodera flava TaxID=63121 RepID=UPI00396A8CC6